MINVDDNILNQEISSQQKLKEAQTSINSELLAHQSKDEKTEILIEDSYNTNYFKPIEK